MFEALLEEVSSCNFFLIDTGTFALYIIILMDDLITEIHKEIKLLFLGTLVVPPLASPNQLVA